MLLLAKEFLKDIVTLFLQAQDQLKPASGQSSAGKHQNVTVQNRVNYHTAYFSQQDALIFHAYSLTITLCGRIKKCLKHCNSGRSVFNPCQGLLPPCASCPHRNSQCSCQLAPPLWTGPLTSDILEPLPWCLVQFQECTLLPAPGT